MLWYGSIASIPSGWVLCDGNNSTPNLTNNFIVGAGGTYSVAATGGSTDAFVVSHTHTASFTGDALGTHSHAISPATRTGGGGTSGGDINVDFGGSIPTNAVSAGTPSGTVAVASAGSTGVGGNLPPYYALCYIMKI